MKPRRWQWLLLLAVLPGLLVARPSAGRVTGLRIREALLAKTDSGMVKYSMVISPDAEHIAYVAHRGNQKCVVLDGVDGKLYSDIPGGHLNESGRRAEIVFSKTGGHIAYVADRDGENLVVLDGVEGKPYHGIPVGAPVFSLDGKRLAYIADQPAQGARGTSQPSTGRQVQEVVVVDGEAGKPFDYITAVPLRFSPDGQHIGYPGRRGNTDVLVLDGVEIAQGDYIGFVDYSADGKRWACKIVQGDKSRMIVDGITGPAYEHIGNDEIFSPDGRHLLFYARINGFDHLIVDGTASTYKGRITENNYGFGPDGTPACVFDAQEGRCVAVGPDVKCYDAVQDIPWFSPDGKRAAYSATRDRRAFVVIDGIEGPAFDQIERSVEFSKDGKRTLYAAKRGQRQLAVVDGVEHPYDEVQTVSFSPDGAHFAIAGKRGGLWSFDIDGKPGKTFPDPITACQFSPDSKRFVYITNRRGKSFATVDGIESGPYDSIDDLAFSADSKHLYFTTGRSGKFNLIVDGERSNAYDGFETPLIIDRERIKFIARRGNEYLRVEVSLNS